MIHLYGILGDVLVHAKNVHWAVNGPLSLLFKRTLFKEKRKPDKFPDEEGIEQEKKASEASSRGLSISISMKPGALISLQKTY